MVIFITRVQESVHLLQTYLSNGLQGATSLKESVHTLSVAFAQSREQCRLPVVVLEVRGGASLQQQRDAAAGIGRERGRENVFV